MLDSHQGLCPRLFGKPHPFGAALKRVLLRSRVQVAEPDSKPRVRTRGFFVDAGLSPGTLSQVIRQASPLRGRAEARSAAQSSPGRGARFKASGENPGLFCGCWTPATQIGWGGAGAKGDATTR